MSTPIKWSLEFDSIEGRVNFGSHSNFILKRFIKTNIPHLNHLPTKASEADDTNPTIPMIIPPVFKSAQKQHDDVCKKSILEASSLVWFKQIEISLE